MATELSVSVELEIAPGVWLELEDPDNGYEIGGNSFGQTQETQTVRNVGEDLMWVEGSGVAIATKTEDVVETVEVLVGGADPVQFDARLQVVRAAFKRLTYGIRRTIGYSRITWSCKPANLSINTQREYLHATIGLISAQVPRYPTVVFEDLTP